MATGTLAALKARILSELARPDLASQVADAINDAIASYQKERFRFSESVPSLPQTFVTIAGQAIYGLAANANIPTILKIDWINYVVGTTTWKLEREQPETLRLWNQANTMVGQPSWYAYEGNQIMLSPVPDKVYTLTLGGFFVVPAPAADGDVGNPWMTDGERLIRSRAKYEIATHVTRNAVMAAAMSPDSRGNNGQPGEAWRAWRELKGEANRVTGRGRIKSMGF